MANVYGAKDPRFQGSFGADANFNRETSNVTAPQGVTAPTQPTFSTGGKVVEPFTGKTPAAPFPTKPGYQWSNPDGTASGWSQQPSYSTPVTSTGQPAPMVAAAPPTPAPTTQGRVEGAPLDPNFDPFAAMGGGVMVPGIGWVPRDHPAAIAFLQQGGGQTTSTSTSTSSGSAGGPGYQNYTPGPTAQYQAPDQAAIEQQLDFQIQQMLLRPELFSAQAIAGMKERSKEEALQMQGDAFSQLGEDAARRGVATPMGTQRRIADSTQSNLIGNYRDIEQNAAEANLNAIREGLRLASGLATERVGRAGSNFQGTLAGQAQAEGNAQAAATINSGNFFQNWQQSSEDRFRQLQLEIQRVLGQGDLDVQRARINQEGSQFDRMFPLNEANILNSILMSRLGYGLNFTQQQQAGQTTLLDWLNGAFR